MKIFWLSIILKRRTKVGFIIIKIQMLKSLISASLVTLAAHATRTKVISDTPTPKLSDCEVGCAVCMKAHFEDEPDVEFGECIDWRDFRYSNLCRPHWGHTERGLCNTEEMEYCFWSFPQASPMRWMDPENKCRTVLNFNRNLDFPW